MIKKTNYLIRIQKRDCSIKFSEGIVHFELADESDRQTIKFESQISDFLSFESQLRDQFKRINYQNRPWIKNVFYISIPNNLDMVQMRCFFDAADHLDAKDTYLLKENLALLLNEQFEVNKQYCIVGLFDSKIELAVIQNYEFRSIKTFYCDAELVGEQVVKELIKSYLPILE